MISFLLTPAPTNITYASDKLEVTLTILILSLIKLIVFPIINFFSYMKTKHPSDNRTPPPKLCEKTFRKKSVSLITLTIKYYAQRNNPKNKNIRFLEP